MRNKYLYLNLNVYSYSSVGFMHMPAGVLGLLHMFTGDVSLLYMSAGVLRLLHMSAGEGFLHRWASLL
jgi:hypothetical protein